ncbi:multi-sensor hybrid histidine kinase, variant [Capsaspora owczarzaki ATCC 30864]|uniref:Multi-sensor hybrid histidine kinase n=1 Tax=Capsaspora owczarzaki (strain ATCC 30864) TaxID=595528 RepID=A0A0D2WMW2_CAPO3|nr:multi-sensor hybrid histidine kinase, variant [Capsaspora owczarzaki ATCC 30864]KJE91583.1 multi-sensor hybrid histidine kinase [Capsaspora owczarzaki ATCC 30864]|eukprot:XP_011270167.1 multi-sensor hybrid histidine kinase, variant [Capsaspora owczarzaki ATCC 30864]
MLSMYNDVAEPVVALTMLADLLIALAYFAVPIEIHIFKKRLPNLPNSVVLVLFESFILACGITHLVHVFMFHFDLMTVMLAAKIACALISVATAIYLIKVIPMALGLQSHALALEQELGQFKQDEAANKLNQRRQHRMVRTLMRAMRTARDEPSILAAAAESLANALNLDRCTIYLPPQHALAAVTLLQSASTEEGASSFHSTHSSAATSTRNLLSHVTSPRSSVASPKGASSPRGVSSFPTSPRSASPAAGKAARLLKSVCEPVDDNEEGIELSSSTAPLLGVETTTAQLSTAAHSSNLYDPKSRRFPIRRRLTTTLSEADVREQLDGPNYNSDSPTSSGRPAPLPTSGSKASMTRSRARTSQELLTSPMVAVTDVQCDSQTSGFSIQSPPTVLNSKAALIKLVSSSVGAVDVMAQPRLIELLEPFSHPQHNGTARLPPKALLAVRVPLPTSITESSQSASRPVSSHVDSDSVALDMDAADLQDDGEEDYAGDDFDADSDSAGSDLTTQRQYAVILLQLDAPHEWAQHETRLVEEVCDQISFALDRARQLMVERKNVEVMLQKDRAKQKAELASHMQGEFLAMMSHELRTPMYAVMGLGELLGETSLNVEQRELVDGMRSSGEVLLRIINDILDFSKYESGMVQLERLPFELLSCMEEALDIVSGKAQERGIRLACLVDSLVPEVVVGDVTRLRQIIVNLLSNAVKFTREGEAVVMVRMASPAVVEMAEQNIAKARVESKESAAPVPAITAGQQAHPLGLRAGRPSLRSASSTSMTGVRQVLHFTVADTGIGIPADRIHVLFNKFFQVDSSVTRKFGGTGLGLAICHKLVSLLGGHIWVDSELHRGSSFHFTLPVETLQTWVGPVMSASPSVHAVHATKSSPETLALTQHFAAAQTRSPDPRGLGLPSSHFTETVPTTSPIMTDNNFASSFSSMSHLLQNNSLANKVVAVVSSHAIELAGLQLYVAATRAVSVPFASVSALLQAHQLHPVQLLQLSPSTSPSSPGIGPSLPSAVLRRSADTLPQPTTRDSMVSPASILSPPPQSQLDGTSVSSRLAAENGHKPAFVTVEPPHSRQLRVDVGVASATFRLGENSHSALRSVDGPVATKVDVVVVDLQTAQEMGEVKLLALVAQHIAPIVLVGPPRLLRPDSLQSEVGCPSIVISKPVHRLQLAKSLLKALGLTTEPRIGGRISQSALLNEAGVRSLRASGGSREDLNVGNGSIPSDLGDASASGRAAYAAVAAATAAAATAAAVSAAVLSNATMVSAPLSQALHENNLDVSELSPSNAYSLALAGGGLSGGEQLFLSNAANHGDLSTALGDRQAQPQDLRILLAEDNPVNQRVTTKLLYVLGYRNVELANNGLEAVAAVKARPFHCVLMDINMPELDGVSASARIMEDPAIAQHRKPYIVAMTANVLVADRQRCVAAGMQGYLSKPCHKVDLDRALRRCILWWQSRGGLNLTE